MEKTEENMFISLKPHSPTRLDIHYIHLDEESIGIEPRKKCGFLVAFSLFLKLVLLIFQSYF